MSGVQDFGTAGHTVHHRSLHQLRPDHQPAQRPAAEPLGQQGGGAALSAGRLSQHQRKHLGGWRGMGGRGERYGQCDSRKTLVTPLTSSWSSECPETSHRAFSVNWMTESTAQAFGWWGRWGSVTQERHWYFSLTSSWSSPWPGTSHRATEGIL